MLSYSQACNRYLRTFYTITVFIKSPVFGSPLNLYLGAAVEFYKKTCLLIVDEHVSVMLTRLSYTGGPKK